MSRGRPGWRRGDVATPPSWFDKLTMRSVDIASYTDFYEPHPELVEGRGSSPL